MKIVLASDNKKKIAEMRAILGDGVEIITKAEAGFESEIEETGKTFEENSFLKADAVCRATKMISVADDSGLTVDYLNGEPGVYSKRWAGENATDEERIAKLLLAMKNAKDRKASFVSVITCCYPDGRHFSVKGVCEGTILDKPRGNGGFGYDPVFLPDGFEKSFAELTPDEKNAISHRGKALRAFAKEIKK